MKAILTVKGSILHKVLDAAKDRIGDFILREYRECKNDTMVIIVETKKDKTEKILGWFTESVKAIKGQGFPSGSLLHYRID